MPQKSGYVGRGFSGTKDRPQIRKEVLAKRDTEKREPTLEETVAKKQKAIRDKQKPSAAAKQQVEKVVSKSRSVDQKIRRIQGRAASLRTRAKEATRGGHKKAAAAFNQAATELLARIPAMRKK